MGLVSWQSRETSPRYDKPVLLLILALLVTAISIVLYSSAVKRSSASGAPGKRANIAAAWWCTVLMVVSFLALEQFARWMGDTYHLAAH